MVTVVGTLLGSEDTLVLKLSFCPNAGSEFVRETNNEQTNDPIWSIVTSATKKRSGADVESITVKRSTCKGRLSPLKI